jgi:hypothetical protein
MFFEFKKFVQPCGGAPMPKSGGLKEPVKRKWIRANGASFGEKCFILKQKGRVNKPFTQANHSQILWQDGRNGISEIQRISVSGKSHSFNPPRLNFDCAISPVTGASQGESPRAKWSHGENGTKQ